MRTRWACIAVCAAVCGTIAAPARFANAETAADVISRLQGQGYTVTIDRIGTAPINQCTVTNVRNPQTITQLLPYRGPGSGGRRHDSVLVPVIVSQSISVSLDCSP